MNVTPKVTPNPNTYLCTRPTLNDILMTAGYTPELKRNPFNANLHAWLYDVTPELAAIVKRYYDDIGKDNLPKAIAAALPKELRN